MQKTTAEAFNKYDIDGNGTLDLEEFTHAFKDGINQMQTSGLVVQDLQHAGRSIPHTYSPCT